jgi:predicted nucleic acid-binding Zn ribbon protein
MSNTAVFQCPRCKEFIAADAKSCRFCSTPIDVQIAQIAIEAQKKENKQYRRKHYARHMLIGTGVFALGLIITLVSYSVAASSREGGHYLITYGLMLSGAGDLLYGLVGWLGELKKE